MAVVLATTCTNVNTIIYTMANTTKAILLRPYY
ncbi:hypothetical protein BOH78_1675 [Pichia kudriavzevii]|uniref:Uncharacterized protein n=2 Tax=Pichia kudriavzevii TaxID=4909 RepID=A0A1V2LSJ3_PICKU|nr:hypothetical protein BOH78_1675 [Pichia kudriavzevii]